MTKGIVVYPQRCTGCGQCLLSCSYAHEGVYWPAVARVQLVHFEERCLSVPMTCVYCEKPVCEEACPTGAMSHHPESGFAQVSEAACIGCKECANACPFGAAGFESGTPRGHPLRPLPRGSGVREDLSEWSHPLRDPHHGHVRASAIPHPGMDLGPGGRGERKGVLDEADPGRGPLR